MVREHDRHADLSAAAAKAGEKVTKEAENAGRAASGAFEESGRAASGAFEESGRAASGAFEESGRAASGAFEESGRAASGMIEASVKGVQDYQTKVVQIFQANAQANLELAQKLIHVRSPADFIDTMSTHLRERTGWMTEQAKELAALGQEATRNAVDAFVHPRG